MNGTLRGQGLRLLFMFWIVIFNFERALEARLHIRFGT